MLSKPSLWLPICANCFIFVEQMEMSQTGNEDTSNENKYSWKSQGLIDLLYYILQTNDWLHG